SNCHFSFPLFQSGNKLFTSAKKESGLSVTKKQPSIQISSPATGCVPAAFFCCRHANPPASLPVNSGAMLQ
ncbi:MAG TPA: hypothetical protein IAA45_07670, partial [Candidatus Blautia gallistercoris]|nr:hypothetical protein [Candidatus Blautia gallistercoris]